MNGLSGKIAAWLERCMRILESVRGRKRFWAFLIVVGVLFGAYVVMRAEVPKQRFVDELHYRSPVGIGTPDDKQAKYHSSEFRAFARLSWGSVREGLDQYVDLHTRGYPPFFAIAFFPFAIFWRVPGVGSALFYLLCYVGGVHAAWCMAAWCRREGEPTRFGLFALVWLIMLPFAAGILARCETDMLVVWPLAVALMLLARSERPVLAGALLGFAASFKVFPALFGVYLICWRSWRAAAGMAVGGVACTVLLPVAVWGPKGALDLHLSWYSSVIAPYYSEGSAGVIGRPYRSTNQSMTAAVHRFLTPIRAGKRRDMRAVNFANLSSAQARRIAMALRALIALGLVALWLICRRKDRTPASRAALMATVPLGMLLVGDPSLSTHHVSLMLPIAVIIARATCMEDAQARRWLWVVAGALFLCLVAALPTVRLYSPFLVATVMLTTATVALVLADRGPTGAIEDESLPA